MDTFYFGRLNYKSEYSIYDLLMYGNRFRIKDKSTQYGIFNVEVIDDKDFGVIFTGELVKYQDIKEEPVVKEDKLSTEYIKDVIQGKARFFLMNETHLIAYNPYGKIISQKMFCEAFSGVIIGADDSFEVDSIIYPINMEYKFLEYLEKMQTLNKLTLSLTPSNPDSRDLWKEIDDDLNEMNAKSYKEEIIANDNQSLNLDEERINKIHMAEDGYGRATGEGKDEDGNDVKISTNEEETIIRKKIKKDLTAREQFFGLKKVFQSVIDRIRN
ncbi:MAG: DUF4747 family protein [Aequorivita sp.]|nr:DUF4747 family protein [Aequorivita sp.]